MYFLFPLFTLSKDIALAGTAESELASPDVYVNLGQLQKASVNKAGQIDYAKPGHKDYPKAYTGLPKPHKKKHQKHGKNHQSYEVKNVDINLFERLMEYLYLNNVKLENYPILSILNQRLKLEPNYMLTEMDEMELNRMVVELNLCSMLYNDRSMLFEYIQNRCSNLNRRDLKGANVGSPILIFKVGELENEEQVVKKD